MPDLVIADRDSSPAEKAGADVVCDGRSDVAVLAKALSVPDREVVLTAGRFDVNAGTAPDGTRYLRPAAGVTIRGAGPGLTRLVAERKPCRIAVDVLFERCRAVACGQRSGTVPAELYQSGFYVQSARLVDCHTERCRKAGFLCKNQEGGGLSLIDCLDTGSAYGLVVEYGGERMRVENFVSDGATRRALQMVGNEAEVEIAIVNFAGTGRPVLLGITERLEYVDSPSHVEDLKRYRARGYAMAGNRIAIMTDHPEDLVEVHPPSRGKVDLGGLTVERGPPATAVG